MGNGSFNVGSYQSRVANQKATGADPFAYTQTMKNTNYADRKVSELLDPAKANSAGAKIRECLDSVDHPNATPIAVLFDETGSMGHIPRDLQSKLHQLEGTVLRRGYVQDPQFCFGGIGDAHNGEIAPLQISQFESDNRLVEALEDIYLEGNGGGNGGETYGLSIYFMANYTKLDCVDKRGVKGYLFLTGDENPLPQITRQEIETYIGDTVEADFTIEQVIAQAQEKFNVYFLHVRTGSSDAQNSLVRWQELLGYNVISLEDASAICETIALVIGRNEGAIVSLDEGIEHLLDAGSDANAAKAAGQALAVFDTKVSTITKVTGSDKLPKPQSAASAGSERI